MEITLFIILVLIAVGIYVYIFFTKKAAQTKKNRTDSQYTLGLNHMLHEENDKAIECFKEYLKVNTKNIDAYIKLGVLLRKTGQPKNALNIHENLLFRQDITKEQKLTILVQLCEDNIALKKFDAAVAKAKEILKIDKSNRFALENLYKLYRDNRNWDLAIDALKRNSKIDASLKKRMMTIYKVQDGIDSYFKDGKYHEARLIFRKAIKIDPTCEVPYYFMGLSYIKDQRNEDAVDWWEKFVETKPKKAYLVFPELKKILFTMGKFERINAFLRNILKKSPDNVETIIALAEFYENKGELDQAISLIDDHIKTHKHNNKLEISLAKFYAVKNNSRKSANLLNDVLINYNKYESLICDHCGTKINEPLWMCENCKEIDTFIK
jgi:lipopolysaccharide biosynthesis regulator YciM